MNEIQGSAPAPKERTIEVREHRNGRADAADHRAREFWPWLTGGVTAILLLIPFHAVLTVSLSQWIGHYTLLRLWKELLLVPLAIGAIYILARDSRLRREILSSKITWGIGIYMAVQTVWGIASYFMQNVTALALGYGWLVNIRYLVFFLIVWVIATRAPTLRTLWPRLVFWPAAIVVVFGLMQYFTLPYDFLKHLGYSNTTIFPYENINSNIHYIRIMSTLRGANPLGVYLILILSLLLARQLKKVWWYALTAGAFLALILTFSRGAWIGLLGSVTALSSLGIRRYTLRRARLTVLTAVFFCLAAGAIGFALKENAAFQNIFLHTETNSTIKATSNQGHISALQIGLSDIVLEPLGRGPGTAGPASIYNQEHQARIAENYFIQIAQETGWLGLGLFVTIIILAGCMLWRRRADPLALGLFAALIGLCIASLFTHIWTDDTLAYLWWGLAAIALANIAPRHNMPYHDEAPCQNSCPNSPAPSNPSSGLRPRSLGRSTSKYTSVGRCGRARNLGQDARKLGWSSYFGKEPKHE